VRRLQVHPQGAWRRVTVLEVVRRESSGVPFAEPRFTSTRATFRISDDGRRLAPLEAAGGSTGLLCPTRPCAPVDLLPWAPPEALDGASVLHGLLARRDPRATEAFADLEAAILARVAALDAGSVVAQAPPDRAGPGPASTGVVWNVSVYGRRSDGGDEPRLQVPLSLEASGEPVTFHRHLDELGVDITARLDLRRGEVGLRALGPAGDEVAGSWSVPANLTEHGALPEVATLQVTGDSRPLQLQGLGALSSVDVFGDLLLVPDPFPPPAATVRLPVAGVRTTEGVRWTRWERLDPGVGPGRVLGVEVRVCPAEGSLDGCAGLLAGGATLGDGFSLQTPGDLRVRLEAFETSVPPEHLWQPRAGEWRSLWVREFAVDPPS
jgi:hypothetical protein